MKAYPEVRVEKIDQIPDISCSCNACARMCEKSRPCWGTPIEMKNLIDAGFSDRLMSVHDGALPTGSSANLLMPAVKGSEGGSAPAYFGFVGGECTFFKDGLCELHALGLKPVEGRKASCKVDHVNLASLVFATWTSPVAKFIFSQWVKAKPHIEN